MPQLLPHPRAPPDTAPGERPDPTNSDAGAPAFDFIPTTHADNT
jgi:aspartyl-tRNA(Asn)/glutamyl-tRNA(Gln) amidotransferase subunit A